MLTLYGINESGMPIATIIKSDLQFLINVAIARLEDRERDDWHYAVIVKIVARQLELASGVSAIFEQTIEWHGHRKR